MKKRNPQDATLRNVRALKGRVAVLEKQLAHCERAVRVLRFALYDFVERRGSSDEGRSGHRRTR